MSGWKCRECGAGVRRFYLLCEPCNEKNSAELERKARIRCAADDLYAAASTLSRNAAKSMGDWFSVRPQDLAALRAALAKARGEE